MSDIAVRVRPTAALRYAIHRCWPAWRGQHVFLSVRDTVPIPMMGKPYHESWGWENGPDGEPVRVLEGKASFAEFYGEIHFKDRAVRELVRSGDVGARQWEAVGEDRVVMALTTSTLAKYTNVTIFIHPRMASQYVPKLVLLDAERAYPEVKRLPERIVHRAPELVEHEGQMVYAGVDEAVFQALYFAGAVKGWVVKTTTGGYHYRQTTP